MVEDGYAPASVARHLASIKSFLSYIYCEGYITSDVSSRLKYKSRRRRLPYTLTVEELNKIMEQIPEKTVLDVRNRAFLEFLYGTGARISEACDIRLDQVLLKEKSVILTGKGRKQRLVPLNIMCMEALKKYLKRRPKTDADDYLFLSRTGKSIGRENIWRMIQKYVKKAGIKKPVSPHTFRHSIATHLVENGADIVMVQRLLGHTNILSTQIYLHLGLEKFRKKFYKYHTR